MSKKIDLTERKFGRLTVVKFSHSNSGTYWVCRCECGGSVTVSAGHLGCGRAKCCGCTKPIKYNGLRCSVDACGDSAKENFMCAKHAQRVRRYGDPHYVTSEDERRRLSRLAQPNLGHLKKTSYKKYLGRHEHRVVAEKVLGRKLLKGEIVHHIDGNKHNNSPENLQVMTQSEHLKEHRAEMQAIANKKKQQNAIT